MFARVTGRRHGHAHHRARSPAQAALRVADDEARVLVAAVEDLVVRLEAVAAPELQQLRDRAEAALYRAKAAVAESAAQVQEEARDFVEPDGARTRHWALLGVAAACAVVIGGLWAGRAVMGE